MDEVRTIVYPTPSEDQIRYKLRRILEDPIVESIDREEKLPLTEMWEGSELPEELDIVIKRGRTLSDLLDIPTFKYYDVIEHLTREYPWLKEGRYNIESYSSPSKNLDIKIYKDYIFFQNRIYHKGAEPRRINRPQDVYIYCLRYSNPSECEKFYELTGIKRIKLIEDLIDNMLDDVYGTVADGDLDTDLGLSDYNTSLGTDYKNLQPYFNELLTIVAERMIQANDDIDLTDRLKYILMHIDNTFYYSYLLKLILYRINDPIVALNFLEGEESELQDTASVESSAEVFTEIANDYIVNRLKIPEVDKWDLLRYISSILYPDSKILK